MASEATVRQGLFINKVDPSTNVKVLNVSKQAEFRVTVDGQKGPAPGAITASRGGEIVDLSMFTIPSLCYIESQDGDTGNYVELCIYDPQTGKTYPFIEVGAGELYVFKLTRNLLEEYAGTGTGTTGPTNKLLVRSFNNPANVVIGAFEK